LPNGSAQVSQENNTGGGVADPEPGFRNSESTIALAASRVSHSAG